MNAEVNLPLVGGGVPGPSTRLGLDFVLSHHVPSRYSRTLAVRIGTRVVRLCSRCTGQLLGAGVYLTVLLSGAAAVGAILAPQIQLIWVVAPLPAAVDWLGQAVRGWESTNVRRVLTGALLGATLLDVALLLATRAWLDLAVAVAVFLGYAFAIAAVLFATGAWRKVLEEHLPGIELPVS